MNSSEEKTWGALAHVLGMVGGWVGFGWVVALVVWMVYKDKSRFVAFHALQALLFQVALTVLGIVAGFLAVTIVLIPVAIVMGIVLLVASFALPILGAVKAYDGQLYELPLIGTIARRNARV
ncbi:MAG: DUF4870 domain-containing protein [Fimbriimonadaceae bacterium]|nr:DUF4870 domain-containing protein [Fimbriimonadaceae bacterium]QYK55976.1 MAG: DUF4870 domain-containing protein [Fimbriimonadaceae bacterium]